MKRKRLFLGLGVLLAAGVVRANVAGDRDKAEDRRVEIPAEVRAVQTVKRLGGKVFRDEKAPGRPVVEVQLWGTNATDKDLKDLAALKQLRFLFLDGTKVTEAGLQEVATCTSLTVLTVERTGVTDNGIQEMEQRLPRCRGIRSHRISLSSW